MEQNLNLKEWVSGIPYELAFWNNIYRWKSAFEGLRNWSRLGQSIQLDGFDVTSFLSQFSHPIVLDVGCGISFANGDYLDTPEGLKPLEVHYIDPLAVYYNRIKRCYHRDMPDVEFGMMEHLSCTYRKKGVKLCIIQNALDHSSEPLAGILHALNVLDIDGCLYLLHHPNEAEAENYKGFHKYNICIDDLGHLLIWNKEKHIVVDDIVAPFATIQTKTLPNGFVVSVLMKKADVDECLLNWEQEATCLVNDQMMLIEMLQHPSYSIGLKLRYWYYNTIHFFVQALSWRQKKWLRRLVYGKKN